MKYHRLNEIIELLQPEWQKEPDTNLLQLLSTLANEMKFEGELAELSDDALIYHLKMRNSAKNEMIPGLAKDHEDDFKTALLKARGFVS
ncbi:YihD family protein [Moritella dasanensis]|uniref:YihD family protein n=1 Tax=Moritella dasanensis TaxID=428031 RepID=UPI000302661C|nr:YihD family protein [Moritella dasanensis]